MTNIRSLSESNWDLSSADVSILPLDLADLDQLPSKASQALELYGKVAEHNLALCIA